MVRFRKEWLVAVVCIVGLGLGAAACKKKDNASGAAEMDPASPLAGGAVAAADDLSLLPADSEFVFGVNVAQVQQSALWKEYSPKLKEKMTGGLAEVKAACGFDPLDAIKSVAIGMKGMGEGKPDGVVVVRGPNKSAVMACTGKLKEEAAKNGSEVTVDGDVIVVKDKSGTTTAMTWVNDTTMVGAIGSQGTKEGALAAAKGGAGLKSSSEFMAMHSKLKPSQSLWMFINGNAPALSKAGSMGVKPKAVFGTVHITDGLAVDMRVRLGTPEEATQLVNMAKGQTGNPQVKAMFDTLDVAADGSDAKITVAMSHQKLQSLIGMVGGMLGGALAGAVSSGAMGGTGSP